MTGDVLIAKTNEAASPEVERPQKFRKNSRNLKVRELTTKIQPNQEAANGAVGG